MVSKPNQVFHWGNDLQQGQILVIYPEMGWCGVSTPRKSKSYCDQATFSSQ